MQKIILNICCILLLAFIISCQSNKNPCSLPQDVLTDINKLDSLTRIPDIRERNRNWMKHNYNEPLIIDANNETYRFICSSSFDGTEIYRVEKEGSVYKATVKTFEEYDTIGKHTEFNISKEVWNNIKDSLEATNFWTYPTSINRKGLDGESWILEAYKLTKDKCTQKKYHRVYRWSPDDTLFISMCKLLYKLKQN